MPKLDITSQERSALRAAAHPLRPVVMIGDKGLTEAVLKEIDANLNSHGLIKVRVAGHERDDRDGMLEAICDQLSCAAVHHLGKILILHRPGASKKEKAAVSEDTRAVRKPSEPYTPKKLAASGVTRTRKDVRRERAERRDEQAPNSAAASTPRRPTPRVAAGTRDSHGIPRRSGGGSALSLRAGARRGLSRGR